MDIESVSMRWFRSNRIFGARLALIAVALQLVLTFGHIHVQARPTADQALSLVASGSLGSDSHSGKPNGLTDQDCPVCALINLSAAATPAAAPALPLPSYAAYVTLRPPVYLAATAAPRTDQRARVRREANWRIVLFRLPNAGDGKGEILADSAETGNNRPTLHGSQDLGWPFIPGNTNGRGHRNNEPAI